MRLKAPHWRILVKNFDLVKMSETIADLVDDHIMVCDTDGQIVFSNRAMQSYLGYTESELRHKKLIDIVAESHVHQIHTLMNGMPEAPSDRAEFRLNGKHGVQKLHFRVFRKDGLVYLFGNEIYVEYGRIREKLDVEISNAIRIHKRSLPESLPDTGHISFASLYLPAEELGGDIFDAFQVDNGLLDDYFEQYVCFVGDVSGHGLDSAMLAIFVKDTIRSFFRLKHTPGQVLSPKEIMHFFNEQYVKEGYPEEYLVCLFIAVFDLKTNELTYCNAGLHTYPLLVRDDADIIELDKVGLPVSTGLDAEGVRYEDSSVQLRPRMTLLMMSDGLPEQRVNREFYEDRLRKLITQIHSLRPIPIVQRVHEDFIDFLRSEKIRDDVTLLVAKLSETLN